MSRQQVEDRVVQGLLALGPGLARVGGSLMAGLRLTQQQSVLLIALSERGPLTQRELRRSLGYARSNVSKTVDDLQHRGLVHVRTDPHDGRSVQVTATDIGRATAAEAMRVYRDWNTAWLAGIDTDQLATLAGLLARLPAPEEVR